MKKENIDRFSENCHWIGKGEKMSDYRSNIGLKALRLRKLFTLKCLPKKTIIKICGLGYYKLFLNGKRVGDDVLSPAFTRYDKRCLYIEYDVSALVAHGVNVVCVELGNGFYNHRTEDVWFLYAAAWRDYVKLMFLMECDGKEQVVSDCTWKADDDGPIVFNGIRTGERYDANLESLWLNKEFDDSCWKNANFAFPPGGRLAKQKLPPERECAFFKPIKITKLADGVLFDFGVCISGYAKVCLTGVKNRVVNLKYGDKLDATGDLDQTNISWPFKNCLAQTDTYICSGVEEKVWQPDFHYNGFQYVKVEGEDIENTIKDIQAVFVHTDLKRIALSTDQLTTLSVKYIGIYTLNAMVDIETDDYEEADSIVKPSKDEYNSGTSSNSGSAAGSSCKSSVGAGGSLAALALIAMAAVKKIRNKGE